MAQTVGRREWDDFLSKSSEPHLLQTGQWGDLKAEFGWQVERVVEGGSGAQILFRPLPLGRTIAYIPKGPLGQVESLLPAIDRVCRNRRAILLKLEPDRWEVGDPAAPPVPPSGFQDARRSIQPPRTILVDLRPDESVLLSNMKQKTRYNIHLARRKGVVVRLSQDMDTFNALIRETGERDAFGVHAPEYYRRAYDLFNPRGMCDLLVAEYRQQPLAALMLFSLGKKSWYLYGASSNEYRNFMPTYLLQWESMRRARDLGCLEYDLWGVPDFGLDHLEAAFLNRSDGLWGVYRFKRGFGGRLARAAGPWDRVYSPLLYRLVEWWTGRGSTD